MFYTSVRKIPLHSLIVLIGPTKSGKSTLCAKMFPDHERIDPDRIREELIGQDTKNDYNQIIWGEVHRRMSLKLSLGERVVIDSSNLNKHNRIAITNTAVSLGVPVFYVIVDRPLNDKKKSSSFSDYYLIERHDILFRDGEKDILRGDGVAEVIDTRTTTFEVIQKFEFANLMTEIQTRNFKGVTAIGDIHGCVEAFRECMDWARARDHLIIMLGDIIDYGPASLECIDEAYKLLTRGQGIMVMGNHERKIERWLEQVRTGKVKVKLSDGNRTTVTAIEALSPAARERFEARFKTVMNLSRHHWVIGNTVFAHGAVDPEMYNIHSSRLFGRFENLALFGEIDSSIPFKENGYPNRTYQWVDRIPKNHIAVVGHDIRGTSKPLVQKGKTGGQALFMDCGSGKGGTSFAVDLLIDGVDLKVQTFIKN